jgi:hypothetical protein
MQNFSYFFSFLTLVSSFVLASATPALANHIMFDVSTDAIVSGTNTVKVTAKVMRASGSKGTRTETFRLFVYDKTGTKVISNNKTLSIPVGAGASATATSNVQGVKDTEYLLRIKDSSGNIHATIARKAVAPGEASGGGSAGGITLPQPETDEENKDPTDEKEICGNQYEFTGTLFGTTCAPAYLRSFYYWAVGVAILASVIMIIYAGYKYTMSQGDPSDINDAKEIIVSTLVGLALLLLSFTILRLLGINVVNS